MGRMSETAREPEMLTMLRQALPGLLRDSLAVPDSSVAVGALLWCDLQSEIRPAAQFVAYLPAGHVVDVPISPDAGDAAQTWAESLAKLAVEVDPGAAEGSSRARLAVYAPLTGGPDCVDIWFGQEVVPWHLPTQDQQLAS